MWKNRAKPTTKTRKDEDNVINKTCNSSNTNEKPKRKISLKEYEDRKLVKPNELVITDLNCDLEVDNIIRDITNTYQFMQRQPISCFVCLFVS